MKTLIRILIILGVMGVIVFLIAQDLVWSGKLEVKTDFLRFTPYFSVIKPQDSVIMENGVNYVKAEPIYFDLYLPRDFDQAKVEVEYKDEFGYKIVIGPNLKNGWDTKALADLPSPSNDYKINSVDFALADTNINNGKLRFMVSISEFKEGNGIFIKSIKITLTRQPLWQGIGQNLLNYFTYVTLLR